MARKRVNPGAGDAEVLNCLAGRLDVSDYSPLPKKHNLRLSHLRRRHGLTGARAILIASLAFDGGAR
jgi:hypothetical protein